MLCSMANILLFLTLEAFFRFSMEDRFLGEGREGLSTASRVSLAGEFGSRPCQNKCGEAVENGEESAGEVSLPNNLPCRAC